MKRFAVNKGRASRAFSKSVGTMKAANIRPVTRGGYRL